jgi:hypothetical protein
MPAMKTINFDSLLARMTAWEQAAFAEFDDGLRDRLAEWFRGWGLTEAQINNETPRCLLALGVMVVQRRAEIEPGCTLAWLRAQARNLTIRFWRDADARSIPRVQLYARRTRRLAGHLNGTSGAYAWVAVAFGVSPGWLRRRHQRMLAGLRQVNPAKHQVMIQQVALNQALMLPAIAE